MRFKELADRKKHVYDEDIEALVDQNASPPRMTASSSSRCTVIAGTRGPQRADHDARRRRHAPITEEAEGNGPVDAIFNAIKALVPHEAVLELYQVHAVTEGTDAQAEVSVRLAADGRSVTARGADPDTLVASAQGLSRGAEQADRPRRAHARPARGGIDGLTAVRRMASGSRSGPDAPRRARF